MDVPDEKCFHGHGIIHGKKTGITTMATTEALNINKMPQYLKNVLNIELMMSMGFSPRTESNSTVANNAIGKKNVPQPTSATRTSTKEKGKGISWRHCSRSYVWRGDHMQNGRDTWSSLDRN